MAARASARARPRAPRGSLPSARRSVFHPSARRSHVVGPRRASNPLFGCLGAKLPARAARDSASEANPAAALDPTLREARARARADQSMGLFAKKKSASGAFVAPSNKISSTPSTVPDDDDILSRIRRELAKVSVDMTARTGRAWTRRRSWSRTLIPCRVGRRGRRLMTVEAPSGKLGVAFESRTSTIVREGLF